MKVRSFFKDLIEKNYKKFKLDLIVTGNEGPEVNFLWHCDRKSSFKIVTGSHHVNLWPEVILLK